MHRHGFWRGGVILTSAISAIDQALWDIKGKRLGVPVYDLLGGPTRRRVRLYTHVGGNTPEATADARAADGRRRLHRTEAGRTPRHRHGW